ncbi:MAG: NHL repeat-containing protein [Chloroflexota bacterium]|nr:NHL repeat-containing protein [Chloroflexota bacterium]
MLRKNRFIILVLGAAFLIGAFTVAAQDAPTAMRIYGQPDAAANVAGHDANGLSFPVGLAIGADGSLYVADRNNSRVLVYANDGDTTADRVYGQHGNLNSYTMNYDGVGGSGLASADSLSFPVGLALDADGGLYVTDRENHRVLYFAADGDTTADRVYGQFGNFTPNPPNNDGGGANGVPSADNIGVFSLGVLADTAGGVYVSDSSNHRVLYFALGDTTADRVYGHGGAFTSGAENNGGAASADTLNFPRGLALDSAGGLYVADRENHRVLYFAADGDTTADRVYGHNASFTAVIANDDGSGNTVTPSADNFNQPPSVALDAKGGLYVADRDNHRVLYFADDGDTSADWVFGQGGSFTTGIANNDGAGVSGTPSATSLNRPQFVYIAADGSLYISDTANNRVLMLPASMLP